MGWWATTESIERLWRPLTEEEKPRAEALIEATETTIRGLAENEGIDLVTPRVFLDEYPEPDFENPNAEPYRLLDRSAMSKMSWAIESVVVDVVARALMTSTNQEPMTQVTQSAGGYTASGTYLVPGGGLFIKKSELERIGLRRQRVQAFDLYGQWPKTEEDIPEGARWRC